MCSKRKKKPRSAISLDSVGKDGELSSSNGSDTRAIISPFSSSLSQSVAVSATKPKRCSLCKKRHTKCNLQTPCGTCVKYRREDTCDCTPRIASSETATDKESLMSNGDVGAVDSSLLSSKASRSNVGSVANPKTCSLCRRRHAKCNMRTPCNTCIKSRREDTCDCTPRVSPIETSAEDDNQLMMSQDDVDDVDSPLSSSSSSSRSRSPPQSQSVPLGRKRSRVSHSPLAGSKRRRNSSNGSQKSQSNSSMSRSSSSLSNHHESRVTRSPSSSLPPTLENPVETSLSCDEDEDIVHRINPEAGNDSESESDAVGRTSRSNLTEEDRAIFERFSFPKTTSRKVRLLLFSGLVWSDPAGIHIVLVSIISRYRT